MRKPQFHASACKNLRQTLELLNKLRNCENILSNSTELPQSRWPADYRVVGKVRLQEETWLSFSCRKQWEEAAEWRRWFTELSHWHRWCKAANEKEILNHRAHNWRLSIFLFCVLAVLASLQFFSHAKHVPTLSLWFCVSLSLENSSSRNPYGSLPHSDFFLVFTLEKNIPSPCRFKQQPWEHSVFKACLFFFIAISLPGLYIDFFFLFPTRI